MTRNFPNWLEGYMHLTRASEAPSSFHFWTGVSTIAGALRRRVWIDELSFQWTPNFYIVLVAPAGIVNKTTSLSIGMSLLAKVKDIHFGPQSGTWQFLTRALRSAAQTVKYVDTKGRDQKTQMSAITCVVGELGTFLKTADGSLMDVLIDLWDGRIGHWSHGTITDGEIKIENPWVNIIAGTTPSWLRANFPETMIGGGLTSRIIFVYGEKKRRLVAYPSQEVTPDDYNTDWRKLLLDLCEISTLAGEYQLTSTARAWGVEWYKKHWNGSSRPAHMASDRYAPYIARKQTHIHKLAMVLTASKSSKLIIEVEELKAAENIITSIEPHMGRVFESIGVAHEARRVGELVSFVRSYNFLTTQELYKLCQPTMSLRDFKEAFTSGCEAGMLIGCMHEGRKGVRTT